MRSFIVAISFFLFIQNSYSQDNLYDSLKLKISMENDDSTKYWTRAQLIWGYLFSIPDSASVYASQNFDLAQKMNDDDALIIVHIQYAILRQTNGDYPNALQYCLQAVQIAERTNSVRRIVESTFTLIDIYREAGDFPQAISNMRRAKALLESKINWDIALEKDEEIANDYVYGLILFAQVLETFNHLDSALIYGRKARQLYLRRWGKSGDTIFFARILAPVMGNAYAKSGDNVTALSYYRQGAGIAGGEKDLMDNYNGVAGVFTKSGQLDSGIFYSNKVLALSELAHYLIGKLEALNRLSEIYKRKHNSDSAARYLDLTLAIKDSLFNARKITGIQAMSFSEKQRQQEFKAQQVQFQNRLRVYLLTGGLGVVLLLAVILYRNNRHKQKAKEKIEKAYDDLKAMQAQLVQSEKMASLGELTAGIAHEIQNPLNFVNNFSEVNKELIEELKKLKSNPDSYRGKSERDEQLELEILNNISANEEKINHHGKRADAIVKGMLQHSQTSSGRKEPVDINALADEYLRLSYHGFRVKDQRESINRTFSATLQTDFDNSIGKINIIPQDIGRAFLNLTTNAFYAVNEKNRLSPEGYEPTVSISTKKAGEQVVIRVKDNGNGISQKILDKIFQPFFTTKPPGQGTGLGLSLCYDIIKAHGGEIGVETKEREGTVFIIQLPIV